MANLAADIEWHAPDVLPHGMHVRGHQGVGAFFAGLSDHWSDFGLEIDDLAEGQSAVLARGRATGKLNGTPLASVRRQGQRYVRSSRRCGEASVFALVRLPVASGHGARVLCVVALSWRRAWWNAGASQPSSPTWW